MHARACARKKAHISLLHGQIKSTNPILESLLFARVVSLCELLARAHVSEVRAYSRVLCSRALLARLAHAPRAPVLLACLAPARV